ncbi:MAG: diaminopimelate epimerase [Actinomycetota bacterium]
MEFAKYHGIGNDFIMIADPEDDLRISPAQVRRLCERRFGIGADGIIRVAPGEDGAELFMDYLNSDGSVGEMCGNGIRCLAVFARERGMTASSELKVGTRAGIKVVEIVDDGRVRVDMGAPIFKPADIPLVSEREDGMREHVMLPPDFEDRLDLACLSLGNPHAVVFVDEPDDVDVPRIGSYIEHHDMFPNKANAEFVAVESPSRIRMRVWERGSGETLACGTGACAAAVAARLLRGVDERVTVALPGGELEVKWAGSLEHDAPVLMTGPVAKSFEGEVDLKGLS